MIFLRGMKHFDAKTLSWWVRDHYKHSAPDPLDYQCIVGSHASSVMEYGHKQLDFHKGWKWSMLDWGWVLETAQETASKEIIKETLVTYDGREAVLTDRLAQGVDHCQLWSCDRDDTFPIGSIVRLVPVKKPCMRELTGQFPF